MAGQVGDSVAQELKRQPAGRVSYTNFKRQPGGEATGKFGGLKGGATGGSMSGGGKSRPSKARDARID